MLRSKFPSLLTCVVTIEVGVERFAVADALPMTDVRSSRYGLHVPQESSLVAYVLFPRGNVDVATDCSGEELVDRQKLGKRREPSLDNPLVSIQDGRTHGLKAF
jgi:hypothetical protein